MSSPIKNSSNCGLLSTTDIATKKDTCDSQKAGATYFSKSVKCEEPSVSIKIDTSIKREVKLTGALQNGVKKVAILKHLPFKIDDTLFNCIDGNERDNDLANKIGNNMPGKTLSFNIKTQDTHREYKPSNEWQEQFIKCVNQGLQDIFDDLAPETAVPLAGNKTIGEFYKNKKIPATCAQFVSFIEINSTSFYDNHLIYLTPLKSAEIKNPFTPLAIIKNNNIVHMFFYIGNNVCIGKLGGDSIFFHTIEDILSHYQEFFETPLNLAIAHIRPSQHLYGT
ncbi:hypothetical protein [Endozoicomonas sp. 8E]|uniref:hypothetical protein n=1 Tax=Endozoicomonas sp. 8E TaxID=3035692 RepID=UPI0029391157|nr:hypothetical protein [Endozoicomonas sp. 8E]WOG26361.1 hypothetical protein P6910_17685 [Endozoicomonas sp. 8E]